MRLFSERLFPWRCAVFGFIQAAMVGLLVWINPNHYTTVDSWYYLETAENLLAGKGPVIRSGDGEVWNSIFPPGYPALIALTAGITGSTALVASKLLNLASGGVLCLLLYRVLPPPKASLALCLLLTGNFLKLWAHTWSEPVFLLVVTAWAVGMCRRRWLVCFGLGIALLLLRYAGIGLCLYAVLPLFRLLLQKKYTRAAPYAAMLSGWLLFLAAQGWVNFCEAGAWYGAGRFGTSISFRQNSLDFAGGLGNQLLFVRNADPGHAAGWIAAGAAMLLLLSALSYRLGGRLTFRSNCTRMLLEVAFVYLAVLFLLRFMTPFDLPGYRLLSPFTWLAGLSLIRAVHFPAGAEGRLRLLCAGAVVASWVSLLPQTPSRDNLYRTRLIRTVTEFLQR